MTGLKLGFFGDSGNSLTNGTSFYYTPGEYERYQLGASGPLQRAVAKMMRSWGVTELVNLGDASYNVNSSSLLDYNIGQYYNEYLAPYGSNPNFAYSRADSIYSLADSGGIQAETGKKQWPYNLYDFPNGFPNPTSGGRGGSPDGLNHFWLTPGNHDTATITGTYSDTNVNQIDFAKEYIGQPSGPDAYDFLNNVNTNPPPPSAPNFNGNKAITKTGSLQQILDYLPYLQLSDNGQTPSYLLPDQVKIGKSDPDGYGIYYSVDLGETIVNGVTRPLVHIAMIDSTRILTDAGYYDFNLGSRKDEASRLKTKIDNYLFDPTDPNSIALFQPPGEPSAPPISYQMYEWVKADLEQSNAVWNIVTSHAPAYHVGNATDPYNKTYFNNPTIVKFLAGLKNSNGKTLFDAFFNGHSHAYSRVLEMAASDQGVGVGIPFITTGNGGKVLDSLNIAPYGTSVLTPQNWQLTSNSRQLNSDYLLQLPGNALPTSVGLSGYFRYSSDNLDPAGQDPSEYTITSNGDTFKLYQSVFNSLLADGNPANEDVSGLYGYGSGAAYVEADDEYFFVNYRTAHTLDPAIVLIGRSQGLSEDEMQRGTPFYNQWSPRSAKVEDLALFSFNVIVNEQNPSGYLDDLQLVQAGDGYFAESIGTNTYTFEILGNNPENPLGFNLPDPTRAAVELTFNGGKLESVAFARDANGNERRGSGYLELSNAVNVNNDNNSSKKPLLIGININLEAQYTLAEQSPDSSLYQDWYLIANTNVDSQAQATGQFGGLQIGLVPSSPKAREILANQPLTTGYNGLGAQRSYIAPQQGSLSLTDVNGTAVAVGTSLQLQNGVGSLQFTRRPAPGAVKVEFGGDPLSSYLVNFLSASQTLDLSYGSWNSGFSKDGPGTIVFDQDVALSMIRTDSLAAPISFGLRRIDSTQPDILIEAGSAATQAALTANSIFIPNGDKSWLSTEGQNLGSWSAFPTQITAGTWRPVALNQAGQELVVSDLVVSGNTIEATFQGGFRAQYNSGGTGTTQSIPGSGQVAVTIQRLGRQDNGLAFYKADAITGAVIHNGVSILPGESGYLQASLATAKADGLILSPDQLPTYGSEVVIGDLPLLAQKNYGLLLLRNNNTNDLVSSYSAANPGGEVRMVSFAAPGRGLVFGIEDQPFGRSANDFNDLIVNLSGSNFEII